MSKKLKLLGVASELLKECQATKVAKLQKLPSMVDRCNDKLKLSGKNVHQDGGLLLDFSHKTCMLGADVNISVLL
jgi:hypothetical protein